MAMTVCKRVLTKVTDAMAMTVCKRVLTKVTDAMDMTVCKRVLTKVTDKEVSIVIQQYILGLQIPTHSRWNGTHISSYPSDIPMLI